MFALTHKYTIYRKKGLFMIRTANKDQYLINLLLLAERRNMSTQSLTDSR